MRLGLDRRTPRALARPNGREILGPPSEALEAALCSPMPVAYVIGSFKVGGAQRHLIEVLRRLDRSRFTPTVYCLKGRGSLVGQVERLGVEVADLAVGESLTAPRTLRQLLRFARDLRRRRVGVLHCYLPRASFFGALAGQLARVPVVLISKRSLEPPHPWSSVLLSRVAVACADAVVANSPQVWDHAVTRERCPSHKLRLLPNGIDLERYATARPCLLDPGRPVVGTVLRLERIKGADCFIEAARRIAAEMPAARFVVVGDGSLRPSLERQREALGLEQQLSLLGEHHDVADILPSFSVFVLPSHVEGMSMALLEAMAAARPVVATAVGGNLSLIRHEETGLLVPPGRPDEIARAVLRLLAQPDWAARLGRAAQAIVHSQHCADTMVRRLERIYQEFLQGRRLCS